MVEAEGAMSRRGFIAGAAALAAGPALAAPGRLRAGAAAVDITPKLGVSLSGTIMQIGPATAIHDRLHARALVLDDGTTRSAIVTADATMVSEEVFDKAKALARNRTGIAAERMLMAGTHTHAAPRMIGIGTTKLDEEYYALFPERIAEAVAQAAANLAPASIGWGRADVPQFPRNRRWFLKPDAMPPNPFGGTDDQVMMHGNRNGLGVKAAGPVDPELSVVMVRRDDGQPLAVLGNYSIHYVGGYARAEVSSDYFGCFAEEMAAVLEAEQARPPFVGILTNGTSGDVASTVRGYDKMRLIARTLAQKAVALMPAMTWQTNAPLAMREMTLELGVRRPDAERLAWARANVDKPLAKGEHRWRQIYCREAIALSQYPAVAKVRLQALRIGDLGIVSIPCEVFAETGLAIKKTSPLKPAFTIELANAYWGYLPTPEQHKLGGYETWPARSSCLEVEAEPKIRAAALDLLRQVAPKQGA